MHYISVDLHFQTQLAAVSGGAAGDNNPRVGNAMKVMPFAAHFHIHLMSMHSSYHDKISLQTSYFHFSHAVQKTNSHLVSH